MQAATWCLMKMVEAALSSIAETRTISFLQYFLSHTPVLQYFDFELQLSWTLGISVADPVHFGPDPDPTY